MGKAPRKMFTSQYPVNVNIYTFLFNNKVVMKMILELLEQTFIQYSPESSKKSMESNFLGNMESTLLMYPCYIKRSCSNKPFITTFMSGHEYKKNDAIDIFVKELH